MTEDLKSTVQTTDVDGQRKPVCTGLTAHWCPIHGVCTCSDDPDNLCSFGAPMSLTDPTCPLHNPNGEHPMPDTCDAKMRPFPNDTEVRCEVVEHDLEAAHRAILRDYAYPGSETLITWQDNDRRTFRGDYPGRCLAGWDMPGKAGCVLPSGHRGDHAA